MAAAQPESPGPEISVPESMESLFDSLETPLLAYAGRLGAEAAVAEDLVQEAFVRLHAQFQHVRAPRSWLYRTVHNLALNHHREAGKVIPFTGPTEGETDPGTVTLPPDPAPLPDEQLARSEGVGMVRRKLLKLDSRSRELVRLKFEEDLSYKEIGARTGLSIGHVGYILHHALKELAADLVKAGLVP